VDRLASVLLFAAVGCFAVAFLLSGVYPWAITDAKRREASIPELAAHVTSEFRLMKTQYPVEFAQFPRATETLTADDAAALPAADPRRAKSEEAWSAAYATALRDGRDIYIAEACWHCHSQFVRPVANEEQRFGAVRSAAHYDTALDRPVMWGTRRVGPDLTNEGGLRPNDWHVAHLYDPRSTSPGSVMPGYTWYFHDGWRVRRRVDPAAAERAGRDASFSHPYPGLYESEADAKSAMEKIAASIPPTLAQEKERLFVARDTGPTVEGLSLIAYLQWLGTWEPKESPQR
jgi:cbb3-type cytochrome c oxidase subunit II